MGGSAVVPALDVRSVAPGLDLVLDTVTTFVALSVVVLAWVRHRHGAGRVGPFLAAAFLVLAIANGLSVALVLLGLDVKSGMSLSVPGQAPLYVFITARSLAVTILIVGSLASLRDRRPTRPGTLVVGAAIGMALLIVAIEMEAGRLTPLGTAGGPGSLPVSTEYGAVSQLVLAALFLVAAALSRRLHRRTGAVGHAWLAVGLVFGAFAQALEAVYPSGYVGLVTAGDFLRLAFDVTLLIGIVADEGATLAGLRVANRDLERLRTLDVQRAALEERAHLSRELHDGLAQNLWLAKLKTGRLSTMPGLGPEADAVVEELEGAIDAGLAEARQAVSALRVSGEMAGPLWDVIARYVDDFADRFGIRADVECPSGRSGLTPRAEAELLRITQEALNNVHQHADATVVRVRASVDDGRVELLVDDNGRGFDPAAVGDRAYGLKSMRERTALIGGELHIDSRPRDGTRVRVIVPLLPAPAPLRL
jgi:signal transduction histidine kinase